VGAVRSAVVIMLLVDCRHFVCNVVALTAVRSILHEIATLQTLQTKKDTQGQLDMCRLHHGTLGT
jgi:hypothetical protein